MKKILILVHTESHKDIRVLRQIEWLRHDYTLFLSAQSKPIDFPENNFTLLPSFKKVFGGRLSIILQALLARIPFNFGYSYLHFFHKSTFEKLSLLDLDLIIANDCNTLPLAYALNRKHPQVKILFDDHEYAPTEYEGNFIWELLYRPVNLALLKSLHFVSKVSTVGHFIAERYTNDYQLTPTVIMNCPSYKGSGRYTVKSQGEHIRLIHHGIVAKDRRPELMVDLMKYLDPRFTLTFMLLGHPKLITSLKQKAEAFPDRIFFIEPVASNEIVSVLSKFDIGIYILPPLNFTYMNALPNKFFEFIQAGLTLAIAPSAEMARIVKKYDLGIVAEDFTPQSLALAINKISNSDLMKYSEHTQIAAKIYSSEQNKILFNEMINDLLEPSD